MAAIPQLRNASYAHRQQSPTYINASPRLPQSPQASVPRSQSSIRLAPGPTAASSTFPPMMAAPTTITTTSPRSAYEIPSFPVPSPNATMRSTSPSMMATLPPFTTTAPRPAYNIPTIPLSSLSAPVGGQSPVKRDDPQLAAMNSLLVPLLKMVEEHIIAHVDVRFDQQQQSLQDLLGQQDNVQEQMQQMRQESDDFKKSFGRAQRFQGAMTAIAQGASPGNAGPTGSLPKPRNLTAAVPIPSDYEVEQHLAAQQCGALGEPLLQAVKQTNSDKAEQGLPGHLVELSKRGADSRMGTLFPNVAGLKITVMEALQKKQYSVEQLYKTTGYFQWVARSSLFQNFILLVIVLNTIWIAIETDYNKADLLSNADQVFQIADNMFCCLFSIEIIVRFMSFKKKADALHDGWFVFDTVLVSMMVGEVWIMPLFFKMFTPADLKFAQGSQIFRLLRLIRLVRVARATRLLQSAPELMVLTSGLLSGMRSVGAVMCLLALFIYVFAVVFTMLLRTVSVGEGLFETVPNSMNTLMLQVICGPDETLLASMLAASGLYYAMLLLFIYFTNLTLMNMLVGILCDVVSNTSADSKDNDFLKEVESQIGRLANVLDTDGDGLISKHEFDIIINDAEITDSFNSLGVDIVGLAHFARFIFEQCPNISYTDFALLVGQFRGSKAATMKDVMDMRRYITVELLGFEHRLSNAAGA